MKVEKLIEITSGSLVTIDETKNNEFEGVYVGDLLSNVMANIEEGELLVTIMCNLNTIAVASLKDVPAIIFAEGKKATEEMITKANELNIAIVESNLKAAHIIKKVFE